MTPLEKIIRPIVEGQIRGFLREHPSILAAVDWYKPRSDKEMTFVNSLSKRIVRDLCSVQSEVRIKAALLEGQMEEQQHSVLGTQSAETEAPNVALHSALGALIPRDERIWE